MEKLLTPSPEATAYPGSAEFQAAKWYALYTCSRHEKQVAVHLEQRHLECFLPLYPSVRRWKDRRVELHLPLFPSYLFVRIPLRDRNEVLNVPGAVRFVAFNGRPAALEEEDLLKLRDALAQGLRAQPHPYLRVGRRVRVRRGPLIGMEGTLVRKKDRFRLVLSIDIIMRSVSVEVDASDVEPLP